MGSTKKRPILIGKIAASVGVHPETVRYYERLGLLPAPERASNGYRIYSEQHLARMDFIKRAQGLGLTLEEIRAVLDLRDQATGACQHVEALLREKIEAVERQIEELRKYRNDLDQSLKECRKSMKRHPEDSICPVIEQWESEGDAAGPDRRAERSSFSGRGSGA